MSHHPHTPELIEHPDAWHQHTAAEGAPQAEHGARVNPVSLLLTLFGIVFGFVFLLLVVWLYYNSYSTQLIADRSEAVTDTQRVEYMTARSGALTRLSQSPGWIDRTGGTVHIPLERARALVIEEYGRQSADAQASQARPAQEVAASEG